MAAFEVVALDEATPQLRAPGVGDTYAMPRPLSVTGGITTERLTLSGNVNAPAWGTSGIGLISNPRTLTDTTSAGTVASAHTNVLGGNTIAASNAATFTHYASLHLAAPTPGANVTLTNRWALSLGGGLRSTGQSLTGAQAQALVDLATTWNTSGTPTALDLNVTDTASNAASLLMNLRVGGNTRARFIKDGSFESYAGATRAIFISPSVGGGAARLGIGNGGSLTFSAGGVDAGTPDLFLVRDAANTLALRNGTNAQGFNVYNTFTDASNYERSFVRWASSNLFIGTEAAGTGTARRIYIQSAAQVTFRTSGTNDRWHIWTDGNLLPEGSNSFSIGSIVNNVRDIHQGGFLAMAEMSAPAAPATNIVRIYAEDNGAGKTRLMARFATGAAQQIAIEP